jgi:hypothetical protein
VNKVNNAKTRFIIGQFVVDSAAYADSAENAAV